MQRKLRFPSFILFLNLIFFSLFMMISSKDWFLVWFSFEVSLMGFLPLFSINNFTILEGLVKYFLVQVSGSAFYLISVMEWNFSSFSFMSVFFPLSMSLKLGLFPFFYWVPSVMSGLSWFGCFILSTVQKISPFIAVVNLTGSIIQFNMFICFSVLSSFFSGLLGINQIYLRHLMGYSSISHTGWMTIAALLSVKILFYYIVLYTFFSLFLFYSFSKNHSDSIMSLGVLGNKDMMSVFFMMVVLSGMPPFVIFFMKVLLINLLVTVNVTSVIVLLLGAGISLYYYMYIMIPSLMNFNMVENKVFFMFLMNLIIPFFILFVVLLWNFEFH